MVFLAVCFFGIDGDEAAAGLEPDAARGREEGPAIGCAEETGFTVCCPAVAAAGGADGVYFSVAADDLDSAHTTNIKRLQEGSYTLLTRFGCCRRGLLAMICGGYLATCQQNTWYESIQLTVAAGGSSPTRTITLNSVEERP